MRTSFFRTILAACCLLTPAVYTTAKPYERRIAPEILEAYDMHAYGLTEQAIQRLSTYGEAHPEDGYGQLVLCMILTEAERPEEALKAGLAADIALPKQDLEMRSANLSNIGKAQLEGNQYDEAVRSFRKALKTDPTNSNAYNRLGWAQISHGQYSEAKKNFMSLIRKDLNRPAGFVGLGEICMRLNQPRKAVEMLDSVLTYDSEYGYAYNAKAHCLAMLNDSVGAADNLILAVIHKDYDAPLLAEQDILERWPDVLIERLKEQTDRHPLDSRYPLLLGKTCEHLGRLQEAAEYYQIGLEHKRLPALAGIIADIYVSLHQYDKALHYADVAGQLAPESNAHLALRAEILQAQGLTADAIATLDTLIRLNADRPDAPAYDQRAQYHMLLRQYEQALRDYNVSDSLRPETPQTIYHRGRAYLALGDTAHAMADMRHVVSIDTFNYVYSDAFFAYALLGEVDKGEQLIQEMLLMTKEEYMGSAHYNAACFYALTHRPDKAFEHLSEAVRAGFDDTDHMRRDPDLDELHDDPRFLPLLEAMQQKHDSPQQPQ
ncbi:MAG: tetratricopeptide repeat protein [Paludibacteraceae bacterium]|nr:tetratricopeptide repeat protein [Paludibacteraceae bacterium]